MPTQRASSEEIRHSVSMRWAEVVLSYLQVLVWPIVVLCAMALFRGQLKGLLSNVTTFSAFGAEAKFAVKLKEEIEVTRTDVERSDSTKAKRDHDEGAELVDQHLLHELSFVEFSDLDPDDPASTAEEALRRLKEAIRKVYAYFEIPVDIIGASTAEQSLGLKTDLDDWDDFFKSVNKCDKFFKKVNELEKSWLTRFTDDPSTDDSTFVSLTGLVYVLSESLYLNVRNSLLNDPRQANKLIEEPEKNREEEEEIEIADNPIEPPHATPI
jgi:hypothetical protein